MTTTADMFDDTATAIRDRIASFGESPDEYNVYGLVHNFSSPADVDALGEGDMLRMLIPARRDDQTETPCPSWCRYEHGHHFESETQEGQQVRYHSIDLPCPRGVDISIVQEETREKGDDSTVSRSPVTIWLTADEDKIDAATAREIAAATELAAAKLEEIISGGAL